MIMKNNNTIRTLKRVLKTCVGENQYCKVPTFTQNINRIRSKQGHIFRYYHMDSDKLRKKTYILGIETSCDDTAVALVDSNGNVSSDIISSQWDMHMKWKGVFPNMASRSHEQNLPIILEQAFKESNLTSWEDVKAIAVTSGPGLAPCLKVGVQQAKGLAQEYGLPIISVNHLEAHVLVCRMMYDIPFPFLVLLVSGGHCQLVWAKDVGSYVPIGSTLDDSIGEAFDKVARMINVYEDSSKLGIHGGKMIETLASKGNETMYNIKEPMKGRKDCNFSYSGLKTAVRKEVEKHEVLSNEQKENIAASFQKAAFDHLITRTLRAIERCETFSTSSIFKLVVCGGVASNEVLRQELSHRIPSNIEVIFPPPRYCTDNGVMIAWTGWEKFKRNLCIDPTALDFKARWPLEDQSAKL